MADLSQNQINSALELQQRVAEVNEQLNLYSAKSGDATAGIKEAKDSIAADQSIKAMSSYDPRSWFHQNYTQETFEAKVRTPYKDALTAYEKALNGTSNLVREKVAPELDEPRRQAVLQLEATLNGNSGIKTNFSSLKNSYDKLAKDSSTNRVEIPDIVRDHQSSPYWHAAQEPRQSTRPAQSGTVLGLPDQPQRYQFGIKELQRYDREIRSLDRSSHGVVAKARVELLASNQNGNPDQLQKAWNYAAAGARYGDRADYFARATFGPEAVKAARPLVQQIVNGDEGAALEAAKNLSSANRNAFNFYLGTAFRSKDHSNGVEAARDVNNRLTNPPGLLVAKGDGQPGSEFVKLENLNARLNTRPLQRLNPI
jgi:hypothetical protein